MVTIRATQDIAAAPEIIFDAVSNIENLPNTSPEIVAIELLSETRSGVGTRFRETRLHKGKEMITELEVTEYEPNKHVRMVADSHGTIWDTAFTLQPAGAATRLSLTMDARAHKLLPRLLNPLMAGVFRRGMNKHLETVKAHCEAIAADG